MASNLPTHNSKPRTRRLIADLTLLLVAVIWGSSFVIQRTAAQEGGLLVFNSLRFLVGALVVAPFAVQSLSKTSGASQASRLVSLEGDALFSPGILLAGILLACGAGFQQIGMKYTTAGNAGFITGLYVVMIPLFLAVFWRRPPRPVVFLAACLAVIGLFLLSAGGVLKINLGDGLVLIGAVFWAMHVILVGWLVQRTGVMILATGQYLVCAIVSLGLAWVFEPEGFRNALDLWWLIALAGVFSVGLGFTLQAFGQRAAPPTDAAIIMSTEAVFAAIAGWFFLDERLSQLQLLGAGIMVLGMLLAQSEVFIQNRKVDYGGSS